MAPLGVRRAAGEPARGRFRRRAGRPHSMSEAMSATVSTWPAPACVLRTLPAEAPRPLVERGVPTASGRFPAAGPAVPAGPAEPREAAEAPGPSGSRASAWSRERPRTPEADSARVRQRESICSEGLYPRRPAAVLRRPLPERAVGSLRPARVRWGAPEEAAPALPSALAPDDREKEALSWDFLRKPTMVVLSGTVPNGVGPPGGRRADRPTERRRSRAMRRRARAVCAPPVCQAGRTAVGNASGAPRRRAGRRRGPAGSTAPR